MKVVLIHGLGRTPLSLLSLEHRLQQLGWHTEQFGYAATLESYDRIVDRLRTRLHMIAQEGVYGIVAHSLGGLLTRSALGLANIAAPKHIVMLGTPNRSPRLAAHAWNLHPFRWFAGQCGLNLVSPGFFEKLPHPPSPYTIVAGTIGPRGFLSPFGHETNDGIVALSETRILDHDRPIQMPVHHTFMMNDRRVQETVINAFRK